MAATGQRKRGRKPSPPSAEVDPQAKVNPTDPDSGIMKTAKGWVQGYNAQAMVTEDQIIIAGALTQDANDVHQLDPMVTAALVNLEIVSGEEVELGAVLADAGYWSEANAGTETTEAELPSPPAKNIANRQPYVTGHRHGGACRATSVPASAWSASSSPSVAGTSPAAVARPSSRSSVR